MDINAGLPRAALTHLSINNLFNRGLVLSIPTSQLQQGKDVLVCATILVEDDKVLTYKTTFLGPVIGQVWIRSVFFCTTVLYIYI